MTNTAIVSRALGWQRRLAGCRLIFPVLHAVSFEQFEEVSCRTHGSYKNSKIARTLFLFENLHVQLFWTVSSWPFIIIWHFWQGSALALCDELMVYSAGSFRNPNTKSLISLQRKKKPNTVQKYCSMHNKNLQREFRQLGLLRSGIENVNF